MWDWDGLDLEAGGSVQGSAGGGAGIVIGPPAVLQGGMGHMRPNTSAAVAPPNEHGSGLLGTGMGLLGGLFNSSRGSRGELGDDDDDYGGAIK